MTKQTIFDYAREAAQAERNLLLLLDPEVKEKIEEETPSGETEFDTQASDASDY